MIPFHLHFTEKFNVKSNRYLVCLNCCFFSLWCVQTQKETFIWLLDSLYCALSPSFQLWNPLNTITSMSLLEEDNCIKSGWNPTDPQFTVNLRSLSSININMPKTSQGLWPCPNTNPHLSLAPPFLFLPVTHLLIPLLSCLHRLRQCCCVRPHAQRTPCLQLDFLQSVGPSRGSWLTHPTTESQWCGAEAEAWLVTLPFTGSLCFDQEW